MCSHCAHFQTRIAAGEITAVSPKGWRLHLAAGWGLTLIDDTGKCLMGTYKAAPARLPRGVRKACLLAADFVDTFGYGNERIDGIKTTAR